MKGEAVLSTAVDATRAAGSVLLRAFGGTKTTIIKGDISNVVTEADLASERVILDRLRSDFPEHGVIAEESGYFPGTSAYTWVLDPLDGTSNFAAGVPWFGVLLALLREGVPVMAVLHLPVGGEMYTAQAGEGAFLNGRRLAVSTATSLHEVLWAYGMDARPTDTERDQDARLLSQLVARVRNVRVTNSLVDAAFTADGRLGGMLNRSTRIWDIAAPMLIVSEAGGACTTATGDPLTLDLSQGAVNRVYEVLAGAPALHKQVAEIVRGEIGKGQQPPGSGLPVD